MKKIITLLLASIVSISCNKNDFDYDDYETRIEYYENIREAEFLDGDELNVVTWNIRLGFAETDGNPWSNSIGGKPEHIDSISQFLLSLNPDIVLLQEVPYDRENTVIKRVLDSIGAKMNYNYAFGGHGFNSDGTYPTRAQWGVAILSKFEIKHIENREVFNLHDIWSRRSVLNATLKIGNDKYLNAYSLHYFTGAPSTESFLSQVQKTREFHQESLFPKIIGGDFNYSNAIDTILNLKNCAPPGYDDIDKIYVSDEIDILEYYHQNEESYIFSDHLAGIVIVKLN